MRGWPVQRSTSISASYCRPYGRLPSTTYRMPAPSTIGFRSSHSSLKRVSAECAATNSRTTAARAPAPRSCASSQASVSRARWNPGVSMSSYNVSPSSRIGYARACVVVPGCGEIATASSSASVATMLLLPLFGCPTIAKRGTLMRRPRHRAAGRAIARSRVPRCRARRRSRHALRRRSAPPRSSSRRRRDA